MATARRCSSTKRACSGEGGQLAGDLEDLAAIRSRSARMPRGPRSAGRAAQGLVEGLRQQLGVAEGVADAVAGDGVAVVAGIPDEGPARAGRLAEVVRHPQHPAHRRGLVPGRAGPPRTWSDLDRGEERVRGPVPAAPRGPRLRGADPDAGLTAVGREDPGERLRRPRWYSIASASRRRSRRTAPAPEVGRTIVSGAPTERAIREPRPSAPTTCARGTSIGPASSWPRTPTTRPARPAARRRRSPRSGCGPCGERRLLEDVVEDDAPGASRKSTP